jgi:hypothetical protein
MNKIFSKMRQLDLDAAKAGEHITHIEGHMAGKYIAGPDNCGDIVVLCDDGEFGYGSLVDFYMTPLIWVRKSEYDDDMFPAYKGDVLYWKDADGVTRKHIADRLEVLSGESVIWQDSGNCVDRGYVSVDRIMFDLPKKNKQIKLIAFIDESWMLRWVREDRWDSIKPPYERVPEEDKFVKLK